MKTMFDAATARNIPRDAKLVAGYINGRYVWTTSDWARFPEATKVRIAIYIPGSKAPMDGDVLDIETGDANSRSRIFAQEWVANRRANGIAPTLYTSKAGMIALGGLHCDYWIADPTGVPHILPETVATQYSWLRGYDLSSTVDDWPRKDVSNMPTPNAPCVAFKLTKSGKGYWMFGADGGVFNYGDAKFFGSIPGTGKPLNNPITCADVSESEQGYAMVSGADYGIFTFGDVPFMGHP